MEMKRIIQYTDAALKNALIVILLLTFLIHIFVFIINWEAYLFGVKLNGTPAGLYLFLKGMSAGLLVFLLMKYRRHTLAVTAFIVLYFGFMFVDSAVTIQTLTDNLYSPLLLVLFIISILFLIIHILATRFSKCDEDMTMIEGAIHAIFITIVAIKTESNVTRNQLLVVCAAILIGFFIGPLIISLFITSLPPPGSLLSIDNSLITKVDVHGITEWETTVRGYAAFPLDVIPANDGGYIISGMFWFPQHGDASLRVMKLDRNGNLVWDIQRERFTYKTNLVNLHAILSTAGEYTVVMGNGFVIRLDEQGNEVWHRDYSRPNVVRDGIPLPDGGFLLTGYTLKGNPSEQGWMKFSGEILRADRKGNIVWEKNATGFSNCDKAALLPEGNLLVSCLYANAVPNQIIALDLQGNYLWTKNVTEKDVGVVYAIVPHDNGTTDVYLHGEGERKCTLDTQGNALKEELLSNKSKSFRHGIVANPVCEVSSLSRDRIQVRVGDVHGFERIFIIDYPINQKDVSDIYSVNPTSDGGYLIFHSLSKLLWGERSFT